MRPLRVALVTEFYYPALGGVAEHVHGLATELVRRGHAVTLVTGGRRDARAALAAPPTPAAYEVVRVGTSRPVLANGSTGWLTSGLGLVRRLREVFDTRRVDLVHVHPAHQPVLPWLAIAAAPGAIVATEHTDFRPSRLERAARALVRAWLRRVDELLFVSPIAREAIERAFGPAAGTVVPNGIDLAFWSEPRARPPALVPGRPHALWIGRIDPRNGLDVALEAARLAARRIDGLRLVVVGNAGAATPLVAEARAAGTDVVCAGARNADRPAFYQACDAVLVTTRIASFGMTLVEAMAAGCPIVASDLPATRWVAGDERSVRLVPVDDAPRFAGELVDLLHDDAGRALQIAHARDRVRAFAWPEVADGVERAYARALAAAEA